MSLGNLLAAPFAFIFFLFASFWPWDTDPNQIKKSSFEIPHDPSLLKALRVALFYEKPEVRVDLSSPYELRQVPGNQLLNQGLLLPSVVIRPDPSGIRVGSVLYPTSGIRLVTQTREIQIEKKKYHNAVQILKNPGGTLTVVNEIDVEDYLKGVLPLESHPSWPEEALKAQAVVSRTYAIFKSIENQNFPFVLSSDVGSQVYGGKTIEQSSTTRAVEKTRGEILTYRGKIFPAFFHSTCGGRTTRADSQWKIEPHPSLMGGECSFCGGSKFFVWKTEFSGFEIQPAKRIFPMQLTKHCGWMPCSILGKHAMHFSEVPVMGLKNTFLYGHARTHS